MRRFIWVTALAVACSGGVDATKATDSGASTGGGTGGDGGSGGGGAGGTFADYINVTVAATGDFTGFEGGYDAVGAWNEVGTPANTELQDLSGDVRDFETDEEVSDATVEIWHGDAVGGAPDSVATSDASGRVGGLEVPNCTPITYKTTTDAALGETKPTIEAHAVYEGSGLDEDGFNSVSTTTYQIIPSLLGVSPEPDKGIIAGTAYDVSDTKIEGAQVIVTDSSGNIAGPSVVKYFVEDFPNREQEYTSPDGLWVAVNVPPGTWNVEMYIADGAGNHLLMGSTVVEVAADSINVSNIYTGYGTGVKLPAGCFAE
jgi:hypothetical protein